MGYESRLYIADYHKDTDWMEVIAAFDLYTMNLEGFVELFKTEVNKEVYLMGECVIEDMYGETLKYTDINSVIEWFDKNTKNMEYRRIRPFVELLKGFIQSEWTNLKVIHYGH